MKVVIAGGSGFIGRHLVANLSGRGDLVVLSRSAVRIAGARGVAWLPGAGGAWQDEVATADVVINLAGESIAGRRWTGAKKERITASRVEATRAIVDVLRAHPSAARLLVNASAVGFYGDRGDEVVTEVSPPGSDFLAGSCASWEAAARVVGDAARLAILRLGVVLSGDGGALPQMARPFRFFAGARLGSGRQWMPWIDIDDVTHLVDAIIDTPSLSGVFNATSPHPATNREMTEGIARALGRPALLVVPAPVVRVALGEMGEALLLSSQRVVPARALAAGHSFRVPELGDSLERHLAR